MADCGKLRYTQQLICRWRPEKYQEVIEIGNPRILDPFASVLNEYIGVLGNAIDSANDHIEPTSQQHVGD